jgi:hypothetical protein
MEWQRAEGIVAHTGHWTLHTAHCTLAAVGDMAPRSELGQGRSGGVVIVEGRGSRVRGRTGRGPWRVPKGVAAARGRSGPKAGLGAGAGGRRGPMDVGDVGRRREGGAASVSLTGRHGGHDGHDGRRASWMRR